MSTLIKKIFVLIILFFIILQINSIAVVSPTADFYVNDFANVLSDDTKDYIIQTNKDLYSKTGAQIVIVTIQSLDGISLEEYATTLFRNFGIGNKEKNNGLLLLLSISDRKSRIEVGYGLEGALPDSKTGRMQDEYMIPYFKENNFNEGVKNGYSAFLQEVAKEYNVDINAQTAVKVGESNDISWLSLIYFLIVVIVIISIVSRRGGKGGPWFFIRWPFW